MTNWTPSINPLGPASIWAVFISAVPWVLAECSFPKRKHLRDLVAVAAPSPLLALVGYAKISVDSSGMGLSYHWDYRWATTPYIFAGYILVAVSVVLAWKAARTARDKLKILAVTELLFAISFLALETFYTFRYMVAESTG